MAQQAIPQPTHTRIPGIGEFAFRVSRNDALLLLVAVTEIGMGLETFLAHLISGSIKFGEAIPVIFGPAAGIALLIGIFLRYRTDRGRLSTLLILAVAAASIGVGVIGTAFHWARVVPPNNVSLGALRWEWMIYAPPVAGPMAFAGVGLLAIFALLEDTRPESGQLTLPGFFTFSTPITQTRQFFLLVALGIYAATLSAFLDHGRTEFEQFWVWIPVVAGLFGAVATTLMAVYEKHTESDYLIFFWIMVIQILMGVLGMGLHINADLPEGGSGIVIERFIRGAPVMAPMLFAIVGAFGLVTMIDAEVAPNGDPEA